MKHLQVFENFVSNKIQITLSFDFISESRVTGTAIGIGKTPQEAAVYCLAAAWHWITTQELTVQSLDQAMNILIEYEENPEESINTLSRVSEEVPVPNFFEDSGVEIISLEAKRDDEPVLDFPIGGYILEGTEDEESKVAADPDWE